MYIKGKKLLGRVKAHKKNGFKSAFEDKVFASIRACGVNISYENKEWPWVSHHIYTADSTLRTKKGLEVVLETKGYLDADDRSKMRHVKAQHPDLVIIFWFQNPKNRISPSSKTTYHEWATKNGFYVINSAVELKYILENN